MYYMRFLKIKMKNLQTQRGITMTYKIDQEIFFQIFKNYKYVQTLFISLYNYERKNSKKELSYDYDGNSSIVK